MDLLEAESEKRVGDKDDTESEGEFPRTEVGNLGVTAKRSPHVIFFLADDLGWNDLTYNNPLTPHPTPNIDQLANNGIHLKQHYAHPWCTPSRAALMTGRYHVNTGLTYILVAGTPIGLPSDIPTLPQQLKREGYYPAMVGKWHLGHGQKKMTPTGRGFESFTGIYTWDTDFYTKQVQELPWNDLLMVDWVKETVSYAPASDGSDEPERIVNFDHFAEPRHSMEAVTSEAVSIIAQHADQRPEQPLFLYVASTAAHSPLQPMPQHMAKCGHVHHLWRREFCGMVVGIDESLNNITQAARNYLGDDVVVVFSSDNGGVPWFGGNNAPLYGSKSNPFEGGVRVPAFITDLSHDQRHLGYNGPAVDFEGPRVFNGLMHLSDWMPTLVSLARRGRGDMAAVEPSWFVGEDGRGTDGFDFVSALRGAGPQSADISPHAIVEAPSPRNEVLLDMYFEDEFIFSQELVALRQGRYKYMSGIVRDDSKYAENAEDDYLQLSNASWFSLRFEDLLKLLDRVFGSGPMDTLRGKMVHGILHTFQGLMQKPSRRLFDLVTDPLEEHNLLEDPHVSEELKQVAARMQSRLDEMKANRRPVLPTYMITPLEEWVMTTTVPGDCSMQPLVQGKQCRFTHPWVPDNMTDLRTYPGLISARDRGKGSLKDVSIRIAAVIVVISLVVTFLRLCFGPLPKEAPKKESKKPKKKSD